MIDEEKFRAAFDESVTNALTYGTGFLKIVPGPRPIDLKFFAIKPEEYPVRVWKDLESEEKYDLNEKVKNGEINTLQALSQAAKTIRDRNDL
jgi:hypothetical protein